MPPYEIIDPTDRPWVVPRRTWLVQADAGRPVLLAAPESRAAWEFLNLADRVHSRMSTRRMALPIGEG